MFFHLSTGPQVWIQFYLHFPHFMSFLFCFSLHTYLVFSWFSLLFLVLSFSSNFMAFSAHVAGKQSSQDPTYLFFHSLTSIYFQFYSEYRNPCFMVPSNVKLSSGFKFPHSSTLSATTASHFVHSSLFDQLYAKEMYFCTFVAKCNNPVQHAPNIHPNVFNSFQRTVILGESYKIFTSPPPPNGVSTSFTIKPFCYLPIFSLSELLKQLKSKFVFSPFGKRSWTARLELWLAIHQATGIRSN